MCGSTPANRLIAAVGVLAAKVSTLRAAERDFRAEGSRLSGCSITPAGRAYIAARSAVSEARDAVLAAERALD